MSTSIPNRGPQLLAVNLTFFSLAAISITLRCYVRTFMVKAFGLDDWLMLAASVTFALYTSFSSAGTFFGTGRHDADLTEEGIRKARMCWWFCYLTYALTMVLTKISIGWFLLRVTTQKLHIWIIRIAIIATCGSGAVFFFVAMFQCSPVHFFWDTRIAGGTCVSPDIIIGLTIVFTIVSVASDFTFAILPGVIVWNLQLNKRTKFLLIPLLAMGCVASAAVIARFPYLPKFREDNFLWNTLDIAIWSTVEQGLAITAGSLATLRPLLKIFGHYFGWSTNKPTGMSGRGYGLSATPHKRTQKSNFSSSKADDVELLAVATDGDERDPEKTAAHSHSRSNEGMSIQIKRDITVEIHREIKVESKPRLMGVTENPSNESINYPVTGYNAYDVGVSR
ncbi:hypothetical protein B0I35DRAFT_349064 [Stachybotrys elegans]|uniref:Rhodopsin domain-containing protein n=1 Tax=Stachybotrys elegans TaxID=80388 RepID=A0A8K0SXF9_9HYPO|nr:hypothetical protein B0I35DRAFT_349064 [Stachybotrys elegans]